MTDKEIRVIREGEESTPTNPRIRTATEVTSAALEEGGIDFVLPRDFDDNLKKQFFDQVELAKKNKSSLMVAEGIKVVDRFAPAPVPQPAPQPEAKPEPVTQAAEEEKPEAQTASEPEVTPEATPEPQQAPMQQQQYYYDPARHYNPHMPFQPAQGVPPQQMNTGAGTEGQPSQTPRQQYQPNQLQPNTAPQTMAPPPGYGYGYLPQGWQPPQYNGFIPPQPPQPTQTAQPQQQPKREQQ